MLGMAKPRPVSSTGTGEIAIPSFIVVAAECEEHVNVTMKI